MDKKVRSRFGGSDATVGKQTVSRLLPGPHQREIGPFVFLDHVYPYKQLPEPKGTKDWDFAHPHRGIATFSYVLSGELEHFDSRGNHGVVSQGGAQWMKAGNGIIHDEHMSAAFREKGGTMHGLQFWINLPATGKNEDPEYLAVLPGMIPSVELGNAMGRLKVLIGTFNGLSSPVPTTGIQFMYHITLPGGSSFSMPTEDRLEYGLFIIGGETSINGDTFNGNELVIFEQSGAELSFTNESRAALDAIVFGGEPYGEPIVAEGPFVMNTQQEIVQAYRDFQEGKYGTVDYSKKSKLNQNSNNK